MVTCDVIRQLQALRPRVTQSDRTAIQNLVSTLCDLREGAMLDLNAREAMSVTIRTLMSVGYTIDLLGELA